MAAQRHGGPVEGASIGDNRRVASRHDLANVVWYKLLRQVEEVLVGEGIARTIDISMSGLGILLPVPLPAGELLFLELSAGQLRLSAVGEVVYANETKEGYFHVGVQFRAVPPNDWIMLKEYCRHEER